MSKSIQQFTTIRTEGALLPPDILQRIASQKVDGMRPTDYHLPEGFKINEAITQSWDMLKKHWKNFQTARETLSDSDTGTGLTNERWLLPLFRELDYGHLTTEKSPVIEERTYPIERFYNHTPIHLIGCNLPLDRRTKGAKGAATSSPHSMVQEFLNRSDDHLWAFLSNGRQLRILRDNISLSRQAFVEFDLEGMMEGEVYSDFAILWMLCHQSRVETEKPQDCWLETWSKLAREEGTRVLNNLRSGVADAIEALGRGFIAHPQNDDLRRKLQETGTLSKDDLYRQLLRVVYRLLFLFVAEDRQLLHPPDADEQACELYDQYYSTSRLREMSLKLRGSKHGDLWHSLSLVFSALGKNDGCPQLGLVGLGSFLWDSTSTADLAGPHEVSGDQIPVQIANDDLLSAIRPLAFVEQDKVQRTVDYRNLGSEELGSVYESLLELHPDMHVEAKQFDLRTAAGNERKTTGSYYTPDSLVQCLLDSALDPVVDDRLKGKKGEEAEQAILDMTVCDPACGSGHFLIAAAHRLARHLARIRTGESEPSPEDYQHALRDVIGRCIYGVDINPMAVELCKVSLWMEALEPGKPLSFLDHHIQCGNSLLGTTPRLLGEGIPDDAFKPIEGDVKAACADLKKRNKKEREEFRQASGKLQKVMFGHPLIKLGNLPAEFKRLSSSPDDSVAEVAEKEERYAKLVKGSDYLSARLLADTWCAAFVWQKDNSDLGKLCPTERDFRNFENNPHSTLPHVKSEVRHLAEQYQFFHWHLAYPDVFSLPDEGGTPENDQTRWNGGFDIVLGNPPWEKLQSEELQWFAVKSPSITDLSGAVRKRAIKQLKETDPELAQCWQLQRRLDATVTSFIKESGRYPLTGKGKFNSYALFTESALRLISSNGTFGMVVPTGIATDDTTKELFNHVMTSSRIKSLFDFENRKRLFPEVDSRMKYCLLTIVGSEQSVPDGTMFTFFALGINDLSERDRVFRLTAEDLERINPNTKTCSILRNKRDAALALLYHITHPILVRDNPVTNPWYIQMHRMFNMTDDSENFSSPNQLRESGFVLKRGNYVGSEGEYFRLYEAKMIHHYDHRWTEHEGEHHFNGNPNVFTISRYYIPKSMLDEYLQDKKWDRNWLLGWRDITNATNERTVIVSIMPAVGVGHTCHLMYPRFGDTIRLLPLVANMSAFALDYAARLKIGGTHLTYGYLKQLPIVDPEFYEHSNFLSSTMNSWISSRVLELTYTAWDLEPFARDCGYDGPPFRWDEDRRFLLRCELDAAYFHLYLGASSEWGMANGDQDQFATHHSSLTDMFPTPRDAVDYIMETFPIVKRKDIKRTAVLNESGEVLQEGTYITKSTILTIYDKMQQAIETGIPYQTHLDPLPGPPTDEDGNFIPMSEWDKADWPVHIYRRVSDQQTLSNKKN